MRKQLERDLEKLCADVGTIDEAVWKLRKIQRYARTKQSVLRDNIKKILQMQSSKNNLNFNHLIVGSKRSSPEKKLTLKSMKKSFNGSKHELNAFFDHSTSNTRLKDLGGQHQAKSQIESFLKVNVHRRKELLALCGCQGSQNLLIVGSIGSGKTSIANAIALESGLPTKRISLLDLLSGVSGVAESKLRNIFTEAQTHSPCVLLFEDIDKGLDASRPTSPSSKLLRQFNVCMDLPDVFVLATVTNKEKLSKEFFSTGRFESVVELNLPKEEERLEILEIVFGKIKTQGVEIRDLVDRTAGYVAADMISLMKRAAERAVYRVFSENNKIPVIESTSLENNSNSDLNATQIEKANTNDNQLVITNADIEQALKLVNPLMKTEGFSSIPDVTWAQVGALRSIKKELENLIIKPLQDKEKCKIFGIESRAGVLLYGPPGCGKTMVAKALANLTRCNFIYVKGPELLSMYVGQSEKSVRTLFQRARMSAPCISTHFILCILCTFLINILLF